MSTFLTILMDNPLMNPVILSLDSLFNTTIIQSCSNSLIYYSTLRLYWLTEATLRYSPCLYKDGKNLLSMCSLSLDHVFILELTFLALVFFKCPHQREAYPFILRIANLKDFSSLCSLSSRSSQQVEPNVVAFQIEPNVVAFQIEVSIKLQCLNLQASEVIPWVLFSSSSFMLIIFMRVIQANIKLLVRWPHCLVGNDPLIYSIFLMSLLTCSLSIRMASYLLISQVGLRKMPLE